MQNRNALLSVDDNRRRESSGFGQRCQLFLTTAIVASALAPLGAYAQALPAGCVSDGASPGIADDGDTVTCLPPPNPISGILTTADDLTINLGDAITTTFLTSYGYGIRMEGAGSQTLNVLNADSSIVGRFDGVSITLTGGAGDLTVRSNGDIRNAGGSTGLTARNFGTGAVNINVAAVKGELGASINNSSAGTDLFFAATGSIEGYLSGITARNNGSGSLTLNVTDVSTFSGNAIIASNSANGDNLTISATGDIIGPASFGIRADNFGSGAIDVRVAKIKAGFGAQFYNSTNGTDLSFVATDYVDGLDIGVIANNYGAGDLTIDIAGTDGGFVGLGASNRGNGRNLSIKSSGMISSFSGDGVSALNDGAGGSLIIDVVDVTGGMNGIEAINSATGSDLLVNAAGDIVGGKIGIEAYNNGAGDLVLDLSGDVTGATEEGVLAVNGTAGGDLILRSTGAIKGGSFSSQRRAIGATNNGSGKIDVTVADALGVDQGIDVTNSATGTDLTVTATGYVTGGFIGIDTVNEGSGASTINILGIVDGGVQAFSKGTDIVITTAAGSQINEGFLEAVSIRNRGTGVTLLDLSGAVDGKILTNTAKGADIIINETGVITGSSTAISTEKNTVPGALAVDDSLTLKSGGIVAGDVRLNDGEDTFYDQGGDFTKVFGGGDIDTANFADTGHDVFGAGSDVNSIREIEIFNFTSGVSGLAGTHTDVKATTIANGATLNARDGATLSGLLTNNGILNIGNSPGVFTVNGDFTQGMDGSLSIEIDETGFDQLVVTGEATLGGALNVIILDRSALEEATRTIIDARNGISGSFDSVNNGLLISNIVEIDEVNFDVNVTTKVNTASTVAGLSSSQEEIGDVLINALTSGDLDPNEFALITAIGSIGDAAALGVALDELGPGALDIGLQYLTASQGSFLDTVLNQSFARDEKGPVQIASLSGGPVSVSSQGGAHAWASVEGRRIHQNDNAQSVGFSGRSFDFMTGISGIGNGPVTVGFAGGYSDYRSDSNGQTGDDIDSKMYRLAVSLRAEIATSVDGHVDSVMSYAGGNTNFTMNMVDPVSSTTISQSGSADIYSIDWQTRLTLEGVNGKQWPLAPYLQIGFGRYRQEAIAVGAGASAAALVVGELVNTRANITIGATHKYQWRDRLGLHVGVSGVHYFGDTQNVFSSRFALAPAGAASFRTFGQTVKRQVQMDAALVYAHESGFTFRVGAFGETGDIDIYGGSIGVSKQF